MLCGRCVEDYGPSVARGLPADSTKVTASTQQKRTPTHPQLLLRPPNSASQQPLRRAL